MVTMMIMISVLTVLLSISAISALRVNRGLYMSSNPFSQFFPSPKTPSSEPTLSVLETPPLEVLPEPVVPEPVVPEPVVLPIIPEVNDMGVPVKGLIDYRGRTTGPIAPESTGFIPPTTSQLWNTKFNLWRQKPWKKIRGKAILKIKLGGSLPLESSEKGVLSLGSPSNYEIVETLTELSTLFSYATYDPRIKAVFIELGGLSAGYGKLQELTTEMRLFRASGKKIIGFSETASEKELFLSQSFDEFYMPPDGTLDIRGFSATPQFFRGIFDKIGIEPQVQRIGKYKSFGDTFNRTTIAEAQREVTSSLLTEASQFWLNAIGKAVNKSADEVASLWTSGGFRTTYEYKEQGYITGVRYLDQVEALLCKEFREPKKGWFSSGDTEEEKEKEKVISESDATMTTESNTTSTTTAVIDRVDQKNDYMFEDFDLSREFDLHPRRSLASVELQRQSNDTEADTKKTKKDKEALAKAKRNPSLVLGGMYLRKMRLGSTILQGLPYREVRGGKRIAIINAVGGIGSGESGNGPNGKTVGSQSLTKLIREAKGDPSIKAVVLRVDSPGGSALASDIMWREIRALSRVKPVVASQVDVAASGGYYLSMACDQIVTNELTVTGSIGVVTSKFNLEKLNEKIGLATETISIGRYAEFFSTDRGFTEEENTLFEEYAQKSYKSFVTKSAASRSMSYDQLHEFAQGRVWTGRQALDNGLVDYLGGIRTAVQLAANLTTDYYPDKKSKNSGDNTADVNEIKSAKERELRVQTLQEGRKGFLSFFGGGKASATSANGRKDLLKMDVDTVSAATAVSVGLASPESMGAESGYGAVLSKLADTKGAQGAVAALSRGGLASVLARIGRIIQDVL